VICFCFLHTIHVASPTGSAIVIAHLLQQYDLCQ
jgi:hypothetical protein